MCSKRKYPTKNAAEQVMRRMWSSKIGYGKLPCRAYKCPACSGFHLTSQPARVSA